MGGGGEMFLEFRLICAQDQIRLVCELIVWKIK